MDGQQASSAEKSAKTLNRNDMHKRFGKPQNPSLKQTDSCCNLQPLDAESYSATLERIVHAALMLARAEKGFITLTNEGEFSLGIDLRRQPLPLSDFRIHAELIDACKKSKMIVRLPQIGDGYEGVNFLAAPLMIEDDNVGYLYLQGQNSLISEESEKWQLLQVFIDHAAAAIRNSQYHYLCRQWQGERVFIKNSLMADERMAIQGRMAAKIGHEINNFLSGINANIEIAMDLVREKSKKQKVIERLAKAQELISRLAALSGSLMNRNGLQANVEKSSLNVVVNKFVEFVEPIYRRSDVQIIKELAPRLPDCRIDQGLMIQALFNLTKNAVEARPDARIVLRTQYDRQARRLFLTIEDNGPGMSADTCSRLFHSFYTDKAGGHGYGLAICKDIVEKHGGTITVESEPKKGARFIISLPVSRKDDYVELEFERIEQLDCAGCFSYPAVIRAQRR